MSAPPMPPPSGPPAPPPMGVPAGPPLPPNAPPMMGGALSPRAVATQQERVAEQAAYLAAKRAYQQAAGAPPPPPPAVAGPTAPPAPPAPSVPPPASGMAPSLPMPGAPPPGPALPPGPAPVGLPSPAPLSAMAEGGQVGALLGPPGVDLLPGVVPAPVLLALYMDRFGGGNGRALQTFAEGGMVPPDLLAQLMGGGNENPMAGFGRNMGSGAADSRGSTGVGAAGPVVPGVDGNVLTPDEEAELAQLEAGPPAPKSFTRWLESGAGLGSEFELDREVYEAWQAQPGRANALFHVVRQALGVDPSGASPELRRAVGLPSGVPDTPMRIQAEREERR